MKGIEVRFRLALKVFVGQGTASWLRNLCSCALELSMGCAHIDRHVLN